MGKGFAKILAEEFSSVRFITYFDFLGFTKIVEQNFLVDLVEAFLDANKQNQEVIKSSKKMVYRGETIEPVEGNFWFSDTLIFYSRDASNNNLAPLVTLSSCLIASFLEKGFPTRCVITRGQFFVGKDQLDKEFFMGRGLLKAFEIEKNMNWCGGIIDAGILDSAGGNKETVTKLEEEMVLIEYPVPLKAGSIQKYHCLGWPRFYKQSYKRDKQNVRGDMTKRLKTSHDWPVEQKIINTEAFCDFHLGRLGNLHN